MMKALTLNLPERLKRLRKGFIIGVRLKILNPIGFMVPSWFYPIGFMVPSWFYSFKVL